MKNNLPIKSTAKTLERLKTAGISIYEIARIINEPESTVRKIFKGYSTYTNLKINSINKKINNYLDGMKGKQIMQEMESAKDVSNIDVVSEIFKHSELSIKLFEIGLNSNKFSPEEKLHFALMHQALRKFEQEKAPQTLKTNHE